MATGPMTFHQGADEGPVEPAIDHCLFLLAH